MGVWGVVDPNSNGQAAEFDEASQAETNIPSGDSATANWSGENHPSTSTDTPVGSFSKSYIKKEKAPGIIISALGDAPLRVVIEAEDDPPKIIQLRDARYASSRTLSRISVQTQLFRMSYQAHNMALYIDHYASLSSQLDVVQWYFGYFLVFPYSSLTVSTYSLFCSPSC